MSLCAGAVFALLAGYASAGSFTEVGAAGAQLTSLSRNGRLAAGINGASAWRWNKDRGAVDMTGFIASNGMSSWGQPVAGAYTATGDMADASAAIYYSNSDLVGGPVVIGAFPNGGPGFDQGAGEAYGISDDGIAVGLAYDATNNPIAFRWTQADGMTRLTVNRPDTFSRANGISRDGRVIYGWNDQETGFRSGVIWIDGEPIDLVDADGNPIGEALAASADGRVVVGSGYNTVNGSEAWRWTQATGAQPIGLLASASAKPGKRLPMPAKTLRSEHADARFAPTTDGFGFAEAYAFAVSDNGNFVVGSSGSFPFREAIVWTPSGGMQHLADYATAHGVTIPAGWDLNTADAVSADGRTIAGWGFGPSSVGSFVIDLHSDRLVDALVTARGTVDFNNLQSGPFVGVPSGTTVTMTFRLDPNGFEIEPGEDTVYPIRVPTFRIAAGSASDTIVGGDSASVHIANDYPLSDGIHLFGTPTSGGQSLAFELFNPGGDMFDSDDLARIDRTFGPEFFEKIAWSVSQGARSMDIILDSVTVSDYKPRVNPH